LQYLSSIIRCRSGIVLPLVNSHFTKPKNVVRTISFGTSAEAADSEEVSLMIKSGRNDDIEASSPQIRVVIADDHPVARQGLSAILGSLDDVKIVGEAADGEEACKLYHQHSPDVLIVDLRMPKKDGLRVIEELMSGGPPKPRIIVITTYEDEEDIRRAVKAGARGYLVKVADCEQFEEAVRAVAAGRSLFPTTITLKLVEAVARPELSKREVEVLQCIANGRSNKGSLLRL
jgi:two-component system, NarL family, response regulator